MRLKRLWIDGFRNLNNFEINFDNNDGKTVLIGNNGSGKSNVLEAISAIFTGLYKLNTPQRKPNFEYEIEYEFYEDTYKLELKRNHNTLNYTFSKNNTNIQVSQMKANPSNYLPKIIMIYSGEELRVWEKYYKYLYSDFMSFVRSEVQNLPTPNLFYINKFYWNISLLTLLFSDLDGNKNFCKRVLKFNNLDDITIKINFNQRNLTNFTQNVVTSFIENLSQNENEKVFTLNDFKNLMFIGNEKELYLKLMASIMNKESRYKLIENIEIKFGDLTTEDLSEGEKKQILLRASLEILADEKTLVLFDEPDANIHVANKIQIKDMLEEYENRETILTTHSPTLMSVFENKLVYLENGRVEGKQRAEILENISGDLMSFAQQQIILNSDKDILIVEGKTDEKYITVALEKLKLSNSEYENLDFNFIYMGGSDSENLKKLVEQFQPKDNQTIIAFFDNDGAGFKCIKEAFNLTTEKQDFNGTTQNNIHIYLYPKKEGFTNADFEIEDYFKIETLRKFMFDNFRTFQDTKKKFKKNDFAEYCNELEPEEFEGFKTLFNLILQIKEQNNGNS